MTAGILIGVFIVVCLGVGFGLLGYWLYSRAMRESKNYERGLKMVPMLIHIPPESDDIEGGGRDERDITEESISQAQVIYNIIASTVTKGFKSKVFGQRHIAFEIVASKGIIYYYAVAPVVLVDVVRQAVAAAYPSARLEEVEEHNVFSKTGKISGTIGGELTLKKSYVYPIATFQESKRDAMRAMLNALSSAGKEDGAAVQILLRPARESWAKDALTSAGKIKKEKESKGGGSSSLVSPKMLEVLWKPPESSDKPEEKRQLSSLESSIIDSIEEKTQYPGYEVLIRVLVSSNTSAKAQSLLKNLVAVFYLFDSPNRNGFKFVVAKNIEEFVTSFIFRFFPQASNKSILNSLELATIFHLPDQKNIPTSQLQRQASKQVDRPNQTLTEGLLLGYNVYRGVKKQIRLNDTDRRRHVYIIGQTGTGKSKLLENLALQDMLEGRGFAFVDPHGDSAEALLGMVPKERVEDVIYFNPGDMENPVGLNMFEFDHPDQKDFLVQEAINMLYSLYDPGHTGIVGPRLEHIFRQSALLLMADPAGGTFVDIPKVLVDQEFRNSKLKYVKDQTVLDFWTKEFPASQRSNEAGEIISWVVSKFGPFISNDAMRNIIGQTKSGFKIREIMDNKKILLVNLSKGKMGELNSNLLGIIFVMKFQVAAMSRADIEDEEKRVDFSLYVDEFQNFATDSFESILSEARKYRLSLILGNQFMTQLTDKVREAIIGNVGTVISGRIGTTDAELLEKRFEPIFNASDLAKLPNFETITTVLINNTPSAPFSMSLIPPLGKPNLKLATALKRLSAAKYGHPRKEVEEAISKRLQPAGKPTKPSLSGAVPKGSPYSAKDSDSKSSQPSFLDEWLAKRKQLANKPDQVLGQSSKPANTSDSFTTIKQPPTPKPFGSQSKSIQPQKPSENSSGPTNSDFEGQIKLR